MLGLAADNLLEAEVVLPDGSQVVATACSNPDIYAAIRGGGGGTYGVVTSAKLKAYPEAPAISIQLTMAPLTPNDTQLFIDVTSFLYQSAVLLGDQGIGGRAGWTIDNPSSTLGGAGGAVLHMSLLALAQPLSQVQALFSPVVSALAYLNGSHLNIAVDYRPYPTYSAWFYDLGNVNAPPAGGIALSSRLLGRAELSDTAALRYMLHLAAGQPGEGVVASVSLVGGPGLARADALSGANPAWRQASLLHVVGRQWTANETAAQVENIHHDVTFVKGAAAAALAPDSGAYMNEGDARDPDYLRSFYGSQLPFLQQVKRRVDPEGVLHCPTCMGSEQWVTDGSGRICKP